MGSANQRKFPRANYPCYLTLWLENKFDTIFTRTLNISASGILVVLDQGLKIASKADVRIEFSNNVFFDCCGTIVRCQRIESSKKDPEKYQVAITFEGLDEARLALLKALVDKLLLLENNP